VRMVGTGTFAAGPGAEPGGFDRGVKNIYHLYSGFP
jgi:hypothetical protein